ncbi:hypothetical protein Patl1_00099 [Pistacia atlantica]|uniref:Uncharacterized protein n=1 Tax=Pistacia atlantica TaxID=434234 RepID=A0ACC1C6F2_9ROSI|nr:hypothetical protein Patl1_00099 [Pistacia atlantica]
MLVFFVLSHSFSVISTSISCQCLRFIKSFRFPAVQLPPQRVVTQMEHYARNKKGHGSSLYTVHLYAPFHLFKI